MFNNTNFSEKKIKMQQIKNEEIYNRTQKRAIIFFTLSLFCNFIKIILLLFDGLATFLSIALCLLFMFFGYFGILSNSLSYTHTQIYIIIVYVDIMLNFLIAFISFYNIFTIYEIYIKKAPGAQSDDGFIYIISIVLIIYSLVSTLLNSLSIYYSKKLIKPILMHKENNYSQDNGAIDKQGKKKIKKFKEIPKLGNEHEGHEVV
ncbi:conserved Plasmodium protein, unknown function [Plasmodium chabaudi chabaudi]|uniref:MARVEL domain-containing protein n=1 Tax=Plasmodium chabaudi chabaudi TaxID=31271 RepID=A0A1D3RRE3_PLACU|nr:conserved Plasmodium protein, unknown function [Plasmodium chabaudi chabaudi]